MSQRYLVTARKYRPKLFRDLASQDHVTSTLKNALRLDRLSHAYLFSGPRGVGKTTAARILAKAINCSTPPDRRDDNAGPCRECDSCRAFEEGRSLDIIELDAASNNKVDDIRDLRETVRIPPQGSKKKVYIIDEVHMLSKQASNALLKTLEEPPPHALFIFATTEPNKVLPTILSRCQRFDFRRIPVPVIIENLETVCKAEDISYDDDSLLLLARKGNGALRDAFSAFDQAVALCGADLKYDDLARALGVVDVDVFFEVTDNVLAQSTGEMLRIVERIVHAGHDFQEFLEGLSEHLRNALVACTLEDTSLIEATDAVRARYAEVATEFTEPDLLRLLMIVGDARRQTRGSTQPRLQLEMTLLKLANMANAADMREVLDRLNSIEGKEGIEEPKSRKAEKPANREPGGGSPERGKGKGEGRKEEIRTGNEEESTSRQADEAAKNAARSDRRGGKEQYESLFNKPALSGSSKKPGSSGGGSKKKSDDGAGGQSTKYEANSEVTGVAEPSAALLTTRQKLVEGWDACVAGMKRDRVDTATLMKHARPEVVADGHLLLQVPDAFHYRLLNNKRKVLLRHIGETLGINLERLEVAVEVRNGFNGKTQETAGEKDPYDLIRQKRKENPAMEALFKHFGGEIVR